MNRAIKTVVALTGALCVTAAGAHGATQCEAIPPSEWKPQMELQQKLSAEGWKIRQVKTWNGCYEVYGTTPAGARTEAFFNPKTFERVDGDDKADAKK